MINKKNSLRIIAIVLVLVFSLSVCLVSLAGCNKKHATTAEELATPVFNFVKTEYASGQNDPTFTINFKGLTIVDKTKIEFNDAFSALDPVGVSSDGGVISISTSGNVANSNKGVLIVKSGFFKEISNDVQFNVDVKTAANYIDQSSFEFEDGILSFTIKLEHPAKDDIAASNLQIVGVEGAQISDVELGEDKKSLFVSVSVEDGELDLNGALTLLNQSTIKIAGAAANQPKAVDVLFNVNRPKVVVYSELANNKLTLDARLNNCTSNELLQTDIAFENTNLVFEGEDANATLDSCEITDQGFTLTITLNDAEIKSYYGNIAITGKKLKALWGEAHDCRGRFSIGLPSYTVTPNMGEDFEEKVMSNPIDFDDVSNVILFVGYAAQLGVSIYAGDPTKIVSSVISLLQFFGITGKSNEPTIADVLAKLEIMDHKLDDINHKIDSLSDQIAKGDAATALGIDKILYNQYQSNWDIFMTNYVEKMEDILRSYETNYRTALINLISSSNPLDLEICFVNGKDEEGHDTQFVAIENPRMLGYSLDGDEIVDRCNISIPASYFADCKASVVHGYNDSFAELLKTALGNYLNDNPNSKLDADAIYNTMVATVQFDVITLEDTLALYNLFVNFANGLSSGKLINYFNMLECFFNFQTEAESSYLTIRANMKLLLIKYATFVGIFADYAGVSGIDRAQLKATYQSAETFLQNHTHVRELEADSNYSYVLNSTIHAVYIRATFDKGYKNPGNDCTFFYHFKFYDYSAGTSESTRKEIDYINNSNILDKTDLLKIQGRYNNLRGYGIVEADKTFKDYLTDSGVYKAAFDEFYDDAVRHNSGEGMQAPIKILAGYDGVSGLTSESFKVCCTSKGCGDYFDIGSTYDYKNKHDSGCWSGVEAKGTIIDFESLTTVTTVINRLARYDEAHWYWSTDEHHAFEMYGYGFYGIVFVKG